MAPGQQEGALRAPGWARSLRDYYRSPAVRARIGVCVDTSHCSLGGFLFEAVARFGERLVHVQVSDNRGVTDDHLPPGQGHIDWSRFRQALVGVGYRGVFMLEVSGNGDIAEHVRAAAEGARRVLNPA